MLFTDDFFIGEENGPFCLISLGGACTIVEPDKCESGFCVDDGEYFYYYCEIVMIIFNVEHHAKSND